MTCAEFMHLMHLYYTGQATPDQVRNLDAHRKSCEKCAEFSRLAEETTCKEFSELLNDYVEGRLPDDRREVFDRHISICTDCAAYVQSYKATMQLSAFAVKQALQRIADEMPDALIEAILAARAEEVSRETSE